MKMKIIAAVFAVLAVEAQGAGKITVEVTGGGSDPASGYYVEYKINDNTYRSDKVGERINAIAYENMSDADKRKTVEYFTFYEDRKEQFGEVVANKMGKDYNANWIQAAEILKTRLTEKDYPGLTERFSDSQTYFNENFLPTTCTVEELSQFPETKKLYDAECEFFSWACSAYEAMRQAEYRRTQVAMQSVAGDLISLICDKVLVPNITPSGALSGAEAIGQQLFSLVLEYVDKASGYCDNAVAMLTGQRVTADIATEVMTAMAGTIDCQYEIIKRSLEACHEMQNQIDAIYPGLKEDYDLALDAHSTAEDNAEKAYFGQSLAGDAAAGSVTTYEQLVSRVAAFKTACQNAVQSDLASRPVDTYEGPSIYYSFINGVLRPDCTDAEVTELKTALKQCHEYYKTYEENCVAWNKAAGEMLKTARQTYHAIASDAKKSGMDFNHELDNIYEAMEAGFKKNRYGLGVLIDLVYDDWWTEDHNAKLENFLAKRKAYQESVVPSITARYQEGVTQYETAVAEYEDAWQALTDVLEALPSYVKSQELCTSGLIVTEDSELSKKFLADGATGTLDEALSVRTTLGSSGDAYRKASYRVRMAKAAVQACAAAFGNGGLYSGQYNCYGSGKSALSKNFKSFTEVSKAYSEHSLTSDEANHSLALKALERDFNTYTYAHCLMLDQLDELNSKRELYSTNVLATAQNRYAEDPYVRTSYAARCLSAKPESGCYTTPMSIVMPGYYVGYGKSWYEIAFCQAADRNRGTCSYSYYISGYAEAVGAIVSDPYDDFIKPLLIEIDAVRANYGGSGQIFEPDLPDDPDPDPVVTPVLFEEVVGGGISEKGATYNGFLGEESLGGTFSLVLKKAKNGISQATMTLVDPSTGKKRKVTGSVDVNTGVCSGDLEGLTIGASGISGTYNGEQLQGRLDAAKAKDADTIALMNAYNGQAYALITADSAGKTALLTVSISKKGKAKISGTFAGKKISGSAQMLVGDNYAAIPFVYVKSGLSVSFVLWIDMSTQTLYDVSGLGEGTELVAAGSAAALEAGDYTFTMDQEDVLALVPNAIDETPYSVVTSWNGRKFNAGKAATVKYDRRSGQVVVNTTRGDNISGLTLKYSRGSLSGSFTVYGLTGTKLSKNKFTIAGLVIDGVGYATATNKKIGSITVKLD